MDLGLTGRRAVVTGGSRGIGLAIGRALAAEGADVALVARGARALDEAAGRVAARSGRLVVAVPADTGSDASVAAMAEEVVGRLGGVDILVNAAATASTGSFPEDTLADEVNVKVQGYLRTARAFAPGMRERGWGRIINISGSAARQTGSLVGSVRNVAVAALSKNLADELGPHGVNVVVVHPGLTRTERTAQTLATMAANRGTDVTDVQRAAEASISIGRMVTAEEVADVVAFLASPRSVALNGDPVVASGGTLGPIHY
ncbi:SDR family oxidoreductase [Streptomyces sp. SL13]|uniref:SDR family oxidoreductase n=1 Tax=Streptantibioticus silvisoli TaxID=2705255 RepID=A0AA90H717_9ACTN|nr:SDR family oxidoreductase [Streptantibioticus silvisoli]MDI5972406.1 SDR family oxidoreductase [Streptantibioticus silvisoli]